VDDEVIERLAQAIHQRYLVEQRKAGVAMGTKAGMFAWDELDEDLREANRAQARGIPATVASVGCAVGPPGPNEVTFTADQVERLARSEHDRWCAQRRQAGWARGDVRDNSRKLTPLLVSWEELAEVERDKDRDAIRNIPVVLRAVELAVVPA